MDFETEKICLNQLVGQKRDVFSVEENIIIPDIKPDILSTIDTSGNVYIYKKELINGKLRIDGGIQVYVMYVADDEANNIRGIQSNIDFSKNIDLDINDENVDFNCSINLKAVECKILNGRKINLRMEMESSVTLYSNESKEFVKTVTNVNNIQMISDSIKINSLKGRGETIVTAKDTISVEENLADIMSSDITVKNKELKISYNKVLSKADAVIQLMYLTEDEQLKYVTSQIPIMGFIDIQGISDDEICECNYEIRNIILKPNNVEDHSVNVEIEFLIKCTAYEDRNIDLIQDLYSPEEDIVMEQETVKLMQNKNMINDSCNVVEKISIPEMKDKKIYDVKVKSNIVKENIYNSSITYEGELILYILFESNMSNRLEVKEQTVTYTHTINSDNINKNTKINTTTDISSRNIAFPSENMIEVSIDINYLLDMYTDNSINLVKSIKVEKSEILTRQNSLVIYFVKEGDTLWKIAKKFKSTIEDIAQMNNIENTEKINVGDQLFIPKYAYSQIS